MPFLFVSASLVLKIYKTYGIGRYSLVLLNVKLNYYVFKVLGFLRNILLKNTKTSHIPNQSQILKSIE